MLQLLRDAGHGAKENRLNNLPLRAATFLKEVIFQTRFLKGEPIIKWAHPLIFWGFCFFVLASALLFIGGIAAPWLWIPQAEVVPVLGTIVDFFAVAVLVGLIASSIRRYIFTPPGLQRTVDATIVVSLIAALMVTYLLAEAGGYASHQLAVQAGQKEAHCGQTWLPAGTGVAKAMLAAGVREQTIANVGFGAWWAHALILLFFLVYLPYSKHMHLIWAPFAVFFAELPVKGTLPLVAESPATGTGTAAATGPGTPLGQFTWRMLLNAYACAECGRCERVCPAAASGSKLSPRQIVHDLKSFVLRDGMAALGGHEAANGRPEFVGGVIEPGTIWACTTCHACVDHCPVRNEHVPFIVQMRRKLVEEGTLDATLQETLVSLQRYGNSQSKSPRTRFQWAKDLPTPLKDARKQPVETLWFLGDYAAFHPVGDAASRLLALVFQAAGLDFGILGEAEQSAGNDVRAAGRRRPVRDARREERQGDGKGHLPANRHHRSAHLPHAQARIRPLRPRQAGRPLYRVARRTRARGAARPQAATERQRRLPRSLLSRPLQRYLRPAAADHRCPGPDAPGNASQPRKQLLLRGRRRQDLDAGRGGALAAAGRAPHDRSPNRCTA